VRWKFSSSASLSLKVSAIQDKAQQSTFLTKIQNRISEKTRKKIVLLSFKQFVKTQFLGVVEFPSIF
jgi:hypothetical protein